MGDREGYRKVRSGIYGIERESFAGHISWSGCDGGRLKDRAVGLADSEGRGNARAGSCHGSSTIVGVACCSGLEDTAEGELEERNDKERGEMHVDGF